MEKLFNDSEVFQKERPTKPTEKQESEFYLNAAKEVIDGGWSTYDAEEIAEDLKQINSHYYNGFELGKMLDDGYNVNCSYRVDVSFCEWLDSLYYEYSKLNEENVKDWVKAHNPKSKFKKGDKILVKETLCYSIKKDEIVYVNGDSEERACYLIDKDPERRGGTVLEYELVESKCEIIS